MNRALYWLALFALCLPALAQKPADLAVIEQNRRAITRKQYEAWLVERFGESNARSFARDWLVRSKTVGSRRAPSKKAIHDRIDAEIQERIDNAFRGDREAWKKEIELTGTTWKAYRRLQEHIVEQELRLETLLRERRTYPESAQREEWERLYGRDGRTLQLRWIVLDVDYPTREPGATREEVNATRLRVEEQALERGRKVVERIGKGESFVGIAWNESDDENTSTQGGLLPPGLDTTGLSEETIAELYTLAPEELSTPVIVRGRVYIFQYLSEKTTPFESVQEEALQSLKLRPFTTTEEDELYAELEAEQPIELLPALKQPPGWTEPVLRIGNQPIQFALYSDWLRTRVGATSARIFAVDRAVRDYAEGLSLTVSAEEIEQRVEELVADQIDANNGNQQKWESRLASQGLTPELFRRQARLRIRTELLAEKSMLKERTFTDEDMRTMWERTYGKDGITLRARVLMRIVREPELPEGATDLERERMRAAEKLRTRAELEDLAQRIEDGEDFAALAKRFSDDELSRDRGGMLEGAFRDRRWPEHFRGELENLPVGGLTSPLFERGAWYLFEVVEKDKVELDEVKDEVRSLLENERPEAIQVAVFMKELLEGSGFRILPGMYE